MKWGAKYDDFIKTRAEADFLEGTTASGKTTVGLFKFMLEVADSPQRQHIIAALDKGTLEKNIIDKDHGIAEEFGAICEYYGNGRGNTTLPHLLFYTPSGIKTIFCLGYDDKTRWKKALGGQYGCLFIDEINVADIEFVREAVMRSDYVIGTLNPDDPALPVYAEFINRARPVDKWAQDTPAELRAMLNSPRAPRWVHWYFNFDDNIALTAEKKARIKRNVPEGTKLWKNKIQGLRGRSTGLVFSNFTERNVRTPAEARGLSFKRFTLGVDTAYSVKSADTIAFVFCGITDTRELYVLEERVFNNADRREPLAPSDVVRELVAFADGCRAVYGDFRHIFIDSADQATITEAQKYKRSQGTAYIFNPAYKDMKVIDRINLELGWIAKEQFIVLDNCRECLREIGVYSWQEDKDAPEDANDHTVNATQYAFLPYVNEIGIEV